jgi:chromatin remodeling complex protein RSC6
VQALWHYIKTRGLVSSSDTSRIECDDHLHAVFGQRQLLVPTITERVVAVLTPMPPIIVDYTLQCAPWAPCRAPTTFPPAHAVTWALAAGIPPSYTPVGQTL